MNRMIQFIIRHITTEEMLREQAEHMERIRMAHAMMMKQH